MGWQDDPLAYPIDAKTQKFLDFIGNAEGADYNTIVGGGKFNSYAQHPNVVGLRTAEGPSTAAGKYQILNSTYKDVAPKIGVNDFSPESQDRIALELIKRAGALEDVQSGNYQNAIKKLGGTWASLPSSQYSQPKRSQAWVEKALDMVVPNAQAAQGGSWMNDPVVGEEPPKAAPKADKSGWMNDPVVGESAPQPAPKATPTQSSTQPQQPSQLTPLLDQVSPIAKKGFRAIDDAVRGAADTMTFGYADEIAAKLDSLFGGGQSGKTNYEEALKAQRQRDSEGGGARIAGQISGALVPGTGVLKALQAPATAGRMGRAAAGAATGAVQGGLYGSGSAEGDLNDRLAGAGEGALWGAGTGGVLGAALPATIGQKVNSYIKEAGGADNAALQAEIAQKVQQEFNNPARMVNGKLAPMTPKELNGKVVNSYLREGRSVIDQLPKDAPGRKDLSAALSRGLNNSVEELAALDNIPGGKEVSSIIQKAMTADKMTAQTLQSPTLAAYGIRGLANAVPPLAGAALGGPLGFATGAILDRYMVAPLARHLTGKMTRTEVGQNIVDKVAKLSEPVLEKTGASEAAQGLSKLQQMAKSAQTTQAAKVEARQAVKQEAGNAAEQLRIRNLQMGIRSNPKFIQGDIGGGTRGTLQYYGRLADSKELAKGLKIIEKTDPYLSPYIASIKQNKGVPNKEILLGLSDRLLKLREDGILKAYTK